jgi:hypothetical protein
MEEATVMMFGSISYVNFMKIMNLSFYKQNGLVTGEETSKMLHLEYSCIWC